jgi:hypothetical protein
MCHADTGLYTREWDEKTHFPSTNIRPESVSRCVEWNSLDNWARKRALIPGQFEYLPGPFKENN